MQIRTPCHLLTMALAALLSVSAGASEPKPADRDRAAITRQLDRYEQSLNSADIDTVMKLYPWQISPWRMSWWNKVRVGACCFTLRHPSNSTTSSDGFVRRLHSYFAESDVSIPLIVGPARCLPDAGRQLEFALTVRLEISRFPFKERAHMQRSMTAPGHRVPAIARSNMLPSAKSTAWAPG